jgi:hypothetical protein
VLAFHLKLDFIFLITTDRPYHGSELSMSATMVILSLITIINTTSAYILIPDFDYVLTDNSALNTTLAEFETAAVTYSTIDSDGFG